MKRILPLLLVGLAAVAPASASAPVSLVFNRPEATPHTRVVATAPPSRILRRARTRKLKVYLQAGQLVPLGRLAVNRNGKGTLWFNVPNLPPSAYPVVLRGLPVRPTTRKVGSFRVVDGPALRTCEQSVSGRLADDWATRYPHIGPVHLIGYDPVKASDPSWNSFALDRVTGQYATKVLLAIEGAAPVTLAVAADDRAVIALSYIGGRFQLHRVTDQDASVTFQPCGNATATQFNGGFVFVRPLCAHFELQIADRQDPLRFALPFGKPC